MTTTSRAVCDNRISMIRINITNAALSVLDLLKARGGAARLEAHSPAESNTAWRPIGSEPKGERILLCWADHPTLAAHVELGKHSACGAYTKTYAKAFSGKPTHWMPLPDAPLPREESNG